MSADLPAPLHAGVLPSGVRARLVPGVNGMAVHVLEAGFEPLAGNQKRPCILLLHGFPELAYSWRKLMLPLADAGYHVIAPDQRGYGRTTGWDGRYDGDVASFRMPALVRDALALVAAFGYHDVAAVVGHDFGSPVAAWCALIRPDVFRSVVLMSAPFAGPPELPFGTAAGAPQPEPAHAAMARALAGLARLTPARKHYQWYYATAQANRDMWHCAQGVHAFLRAYYHCKSGDWEQNRPHPLQAWTATELARLPTYYVMENDLDMAQTVAPHMPSSEQVAACHWLTDNELAVYSTEYARTGFQGGLQWYRCATDARSLVELQLFAGRTIDVPACFIAGQGDWGVFQSPGAFEKMRAVACTRLLGCHLVPGAGHWVQQERAAEVDRLLQGFLQAARRA